LVCSGSFTPTPGINFVASLVPLEKASSCVAVTTTPGYCNSINYLPTQTDAFSAPTAPPMPVTIVGSGFGYYPQTLPYAAQNPQYLQINDDGNGSGTPWNTAGTTVLPIAACKVYVANWSDTSISLVINAPIEPYNLYLPPGDYLSPLSDFSPLTLFPSPSGYNTQVCPVGTGDTLTFYVTNPEYTGSGTNSLAVCVGTPGVAPPTCPI
jgi:hypothetical protein